MAPPSGAPRLGSRQYNDRKTSFKQLGASDERLDVGSADGAAVAEILRARASLVGADRLTKLLSNSSTAGPTIEEEVQEEQEAEWEVEESGLSRVASRNLARVQINLGLGARGVLGPDTPGDVGLAFYDETPRAGEGAPDSPATPGSSPSSVTIALDDIALAPLKVDYHRIDSNASSASGGNGSPGLEVFGDLGYEDGSSGSPLSQFASTVEVDEAYYMAVRSIMLAWEDAPGSLVERLQLADVLRLAFGKGKAEHLQVLRRALRDNGRAADELAARIDDLEERVTEDFPEKQAAEEWEEAELTELRRLLRQQLQLPALNAMLEVAVIKGTDLKSKAAARRFACLAPHVVTDHFVVIDLLQQPVVPGSPHGSTHTAARPAPLRTDLARGNSPQWDSKASPMHLQQAPATMRMQVCTSGFFEDQSREAKAVRNVLPLMSSMPVDTFSSLGQHTIGWCRIALRRDNLEPETSYLLPVTRTVPILRKSRGAFGPCLAPQNDLPPLRPEEEEGPQRKGHKGWTEMGEVQIVMRYVPETRSASPGSSEIRDIAKSLQQAARKGSHAPPPSVAAEVCRKLADTAGGGPAVDAPAPMSMDEGARLYAALMMRLWDCWSKDISVREDGHTFGLTGRSVTAPDLSGKPSASARQTLTKAAAKGSWSQGQGASSSAKAGAPLQLEGPSGTAAKDCTANASEGARALSRYCPGAPWTDVLAAATKLYRVRTTWHQLLMVKRLLQSWRLEPDYLEALLVLWKPIVAVARDGKCTRREGLLHVGCTQLIVRHSIRAIEFYHVAFGNRCSVGSTVLGLRRLLELTCLAIRYDSHLDALVEPLKIHIERAVRRRVRKALPRGPMKRDGYLEALREAIELATTSLRRDLELADAFPESLDLPHFTARLRYKKLSDHMLHIFTGPGVVAYDHLVMGVQDGMYELHQLMIDAGVSVHFLSGSQPGAAHIALLNLHKIFGRSLLKWIRDIGLNMKEWVDNAVRVDQTASWTPIGGRIFYSTSVVDLLRIFQDVAEKARERMPPMSEQATLHSDIYERLQASIHYVLRHYAEILEELCIAGLNKARRERHMELQEESQHAHPSTILRLLHTTTADSDGGMDAPAEDPCVNRQLCVLLSNLHALQDNIPMVNKRMLEVVCGEKLAREKLGTAMEDTVPGDEDFDDSLSELSFMSDELDTEQPQEQLGGKLAALEGDLAGGADFQEGGEPGLQRVAVASREVEGMPQQRLRAWQKYCHANTRVLGTSVSNCINCMADTLQAKLLLEVIRLLRAEEMRAQMLDSVAEGAVPKKRTSAFDLTLKSLRPSSAKHHISPEHAAAFLKEVDLDIFMQRLLDVEINLLASHMVPSVSRTVMTSTWCSLVSAMESLVLGNSGWWRPLTAREGRIISKLLEAATAWFHSDGDGLPKEDLQSAASRLMELLELHVEPVSALELKYDEVWVAHGGKEELRRKQGAPPSGWTKTGDDASSAQPGLVSSFESRFRADVSNGVSMIHLIRLLRQRPHEPAAVDLLNKLLRDAGEFPMQVIFGKWDEPMLGKWPVMLARQQQAGILCVSLRFVGFTTIRPGASGIGDESLLLPLAQVTRMDRSYENHVQCLSFTMHDKTYHPFGAGQKVFAAREDIYACVAEAVSGSGTTLDRSLRGEVATEGAKTLKLPSGEEIFHSLECTRIISGGLWYNRGVLYTCKSFAMFDRPGKERIVVPYGAMLNMKMEEAGGWAAQPDMRLVLDTRAMGRLVFGKCAVDEVIAAMSSIATRVAAVNEYNDK